MPLVATYLAIVSFVGWLFGGFWIYPDHVSPFLNLISNDFFRVVAFVGYLLLLIIIAILAFILTINVICKLFESWSDDND